MPTPFTHLCDLEKQRVKIGSGVFLFSLLVTSLFLISIGCGDHKKHQREINGIQLFLTEVARQKAQLADRAFLQEKARQLFLKLHDKDADSSNPADARALDELITVYIVPLIQAAAPEDGEIVRHFSDRVARPAIRHRYPLVESRLALVVWIASGVLYWLIVLLLYAYCDLHPSESEPIINVIDVGFFGILVQYTGGMSSEFRIVFLLSLLLSAVDFCHQELTVPYKDYRFGKRWLVLLGPYAMALLLSLFWAVSDRVLILQEAFLEYCVEWLLMLGIGVGAWIVFYLIMKLPVEQHGTKETSIAGAPK